MHQYVYDRFILIMLNLILSKNEFAKTFDIFSGTTDNEIAHQLFTIIEDTHFIQLPRLDCIFHSFNQSGKFSLLHTISLTLPQCNSKIQGEN
jgi:hypothetical protein